MDPKNLNTGLTDLISLLPHDILGDILSRLPTKVAASTSVLSKKWRTLFALVHNLDFDDSDFVKPVQSNFILSKETRQCFVNFVDRTFDLRCGSSIKKFSLKLNQYANYEKHNVGRWVTNVVECNVLELYLRINNRNELPYELFRSKTLVKLTLGSEYYIEKLPRDLSLPALKSLSIGPILFDHQEFYKILLAGCPVLEDLSILHVFDGEAPYCICNQTIKKLKVSYDNYTYLALISEMSFDTPNLVSLDYTDVVKTKYLRVNFKSLLEAKLDLTYSENIYSLDLTNLILGIKNVQSLHLSTNTVYAIYRCCKQGLVLPVFNNLVNLTVGSCNKKGWKLLPNLLKHTPKLETLTIESLRGYKNNVTLSPFQVKVLHVLGFGNTLSDLEDNDTIPETIRVILEMAAPKCKIKLEIIICLAYSIILCYALSYF